MERAMEQLNVQLSRLTRSLRRARTVELPDGKTREGAAAAEQTVPGWSRLRLAGLKLRISHLPRTFPLLVSGAAPSSEVQTRPSQRRKDLTAFLSEHTTVWLLWVLPLWFPSTDNETAVYTLMPMVMADQHRLASRSRPGYSPSTRPWVHGKLFSTCFPPSCLKGRFLSCSSTPSLT